MSPRSLGTLTVGKLAQAAQVGVETIRYYQERGLLAVPDAVGTYRHYPASAVSRIRFVKRAQELGFSLDEIGELLSLEDGVDRASIRRIANSRLVQIQTRLGDLDQMKKALSRLVQQCEHADTGHACPIISTLARKSD